MAKIRAFDLPFLDDAFEMTGGYVLNFTDRTFAYFFATELSIDITDQKYDRNGTSKANRLRTFLQAEPAPIVAKTFRLLWEHRDAIRGPFDEQDETVQRQKARFLEIVYSLESATRTPRTDAIEKFMDNQTLEELVSAIERDIAADRPEAALDRLHTYWKNA